MTTLADFLRQLRRIYVPARAPLVCTTVAEELRERFAPEAQLRRRPSRPAARSLTITVGDGKDVSFHVGAGGRATLAADEACRLYAFFAWLTETQGATPSSRWQRPRSIKPAFQAERPIFDLYFTQSGRTIRHQDPEGYVRQMARGGFSHLEVNGLAFPEAQEEGVEGEVYPRFYTYCPALDQFVDSFLNRGIYPKAYLRANLERLKRNAALAERYGLVPTLTCFEPRSVPDALLARYPELRGCRVDHPFRSFKARFNLAVAHPVVRRHYREMMQNLLAEVPQLGGLSVWTNDSGAGFEFTRSLYVGPNGSAYLVREWSEEDVFTRAAAKNVVDFLRLLQASAAEVQPDFRVITRLEPFGPERADVIAGLGRGIDVEVATLLEEGWSSPYGHPEYDDADMAPFTLYNHQFHVEEKREIRRLAARDCRTHVMHAHGPVNNIEPLLGIPFPWLAREKIAAMRAGGATHLAHFGGMAPPASVPFDVNREVFRRFLFAPRQDVEAALGEVATSWIGTEHAADLVEVWREVDGAIRAFMPNPLYFCWGVWYRILIRPLVPDIEAIPPRERAYYERHLLTTHHNPTQVDLSRDVLFRLMTPSLAAKTAQRIDRRALPLLARARKRLDRLREAASDDDAVLVDLADRLEALTCWMTTRRSVASWIADVHGYRATTNAAKRRACRKRLKTMVAAEIENARALLALWKRSKVDFMAVSEGEETTFIYDRSFGAHLKRKIRLMERYGDREPRIDEDVMWRVEGLRSKMT